MDRQTLQNHLDELFSEIADERGDEFGLTVLQDALGALVQWSAATSGAGITTRVYMHATPAQSYAGQRGPLVEAAITGCLEHDIATHKAKGLGTVTIRGHDEYTTVPVAAAAKRGIDKDVGTTITLALIYDVDEFREYNHAIEEA